MTLSQDCIKKSSTENGNTEKACLVFLIVRRSCSVLSYAFGSGSSERALEVLATLEKKRMAHVNLTLDRTM